MTKMNKPVVYLDKGFSKRGNGWYKVPKTEKKKKLVCSKAVRKPCGVKLVLG